MIISLTFATLKWTAVCRPGGWVHLYRGDPSMAHGEPYAVGRFASNKGVFGLGTDDPKRVVPLGLAEALSTKIRERHKEERPCK